MLFYRAGGAASRREIIDMGGNYLKEEKTQTINSQIRRCLEGRPEECSIVRRMA
jgi:hypothetical protein